MMTYQNVIYFFCPYILFCLFVSLVFPFFSNFFYLVFHTMFNGACVLATVATPKSPRTPTVGGPAVMAHTINHRFTMTFKMLTVCDLCLKQMFIGKSNEKL